MEIREVSADDTSIVGEVVDLVNAVASVDSPWVHRENVATYAAMMRHGWDGEAPRCFVGREAGRLVAAGELSMSDWDNRHVAWAVLRVLPADRRRGHGSELFDFLVQQSRLAGRRSIALGGWDTPAIRAFAEAHRLPRRAAEVSRRQYLAELDRTLVEQMYADASTTAADYELLHIRGRTPEHMLDALAEMTASINDAPTDDLDIEDEVFPRGRIEDYETATLAKNQRLYRAVARHRVTGELAGHTTVAVDGERPALAEQHDTTVVRRHRGHRLGVFLKADMLRWLAAAEPQLEMVDTWNAESNNQMIDVNAELGYRICGRALDFQRDI